ncbi:chemotaxis protein CheW [Oscillibacter sp.]|uniref:chemotaxis protein CheW n=1 Tax=Oscillibacter sp. TaxID=1945593 RepID=UPI00289C9DD1|nr:chemotaxis protein CheW [Oscillibacter sp.]
MDNQVMSFMEDGTSARAALTEEMEQFLVFQCDALRVGIRVDCVVEALINQSITPLPMLPNYVCGIINLRGEVVPVVSIRLRLGKPAADEQSVIVLNINGMQLGVLVDRVDQMVKLPRSSLLPMPATNGQKLMCGMSSLPDGGTMLELDAAALLEH